MRRIYINSSTYLAVFSHRINLSLSRRMPIQKTVSQLLSLKQREVFSVVCSESVKPFQENFHHPHALLLASWSEGGHV
jgi:hypothetical protein